MKSIIILCAALFSLVYCTSKKSDQPVVQSDQQQSSSSSSQSSSSQQSSVSVAYPLTWEKNHPERSAWTKIINDLVRKDLAVFDGAKDITQFRADYKSLTTDQRVAVVSQIFASDAYYESSWNPAEASVDVGSADDKNSWSIGLLQMSVEDQDWAAGGIFKTKTGWKYTYDQLLTAGPNLELAEAVMVQQIKDRGVIMIPVGEKGLYWATLHPPNGKYDQSKSIINDVKAMKF